MKKRSQTPSAQTFGGSASTATTFECGLVFSRQPLRIHGKTRDVVAVWKAGEARNAPAYVVVIGSVTRTTESLIGCAVLALEHVGITRPRIGSIKRVAEVVQRLSLLRQSPSTGSHPRPY